MAKTNEGKCQFCYKVYSKTSIKKHLDKCKMNSAEYVTDDTDKLETYFCISVQGYYNSEYWLYIDIPSNTSFSVLDQFLRDIWLECCGHLSMFEIDGQTFSSSPDKDFGDRSMNTKLGSILDIGMQFKYEYDFGSTTVLKLKVVSNFEAKKRRIKVKLLARNIQPSIKCFHCDKPATNVCCQCGYDEDAWICDDCLDKHECGDDMFLPVVNSPRVGVCAYTGGFLDE